VPLDPKSLIRHTTTKVNQVLTTSRDAYGQIKYWRRPWMLLNYDLNFF
jgi:hypothetical protein